MAVIRGRRWVIAITVALVIVGVGVAAAVVLWTDGGDPQPRAQERKEVRETERSAETESGSDVFPTENDQRLLALLSPEFEERCGPRAVNKRGISNLICNDLPGLLGDMNVEYHLFASRKDTEAWLESIRAETLIPRNSGACTPNHFEGERPYRRDGGRMLCFNDQFGFSTLYWTELDSNVGGQVYMKTGIDPRRVLEAWACCLQDGR